MKKHFIGKCILFACLGIALAIGLSYVVMLLWNWLVPDLFGGPVVDVWKAAGLLILSKILFSSFGKGGKGCCSCSGSKGRFWKHKLDNMTPEEREKMKNKWKCWGNTCDTESKE